MQYVGGTFTFRFRRLRRLWDAAAGCAVEFQAGLHTVFTGDDLTVHDGNTAQSIATNKVRSLAVLDQCSCILVLVDMAAHVARNEVGLASVSRRTMRSMRYGIDL